MLLMYVPFLGELVYLVNFTIRSGVNELRAMYVIEAGEEVTIDN